MMTDSFERAWRRLVPAFAAYHDVRRSPENLDMLVEARFELEDARAETRRSRQLVAAASPVAEHAVSRADVSHEDRARLGVYGIGTVGEG